MEPAVRHLSEAFRLLADSRYLIRSAQWLNTFEVAAIAKWVYLDGHGRKPQAINWPDVLNAYKFLWRETEDATDYPDDPGVVASFILRLVYQQLIWNITPEKMQANFARARAIFGGPLAASSTLRSLFERETGVAFEDFLKAAHVLYGVFKKHGWSVEDYKLVEAMQRTFSAEVVSSVLRALSATRGGFRRYYETVAAAETPQGVVYEINPLLRYPILHHRDRYWCVFPELINYAATRGLYFYIADLAGDGFSRLFSDAFEDYVATLCRNAYGLESVLTEADDRALRWKGKTNDVTVLVDNAALLVECKNSGLFSVSKRSADPADLLADIRKNLANADKRKGLFQLHEKIEAINNDRLPPDLQARFQGKQHFYPVLLLHDEIWFANRPEALKTLIDTELAAHGITNFNYQIWHVQELELLLKHVPKDQLAVVLHEKFHDPTHCALDLSVYLADRFKLPNLAIQLFVPHGGSKAWNILRQLADQS